MLGWAALVLALFVERARGAAFAATGAAIPALIAVAYIILLSQGWGQTEGGGFGSIGEVRALFANDSALAAGWLHYLAFDLFVGTWIAREGLRTGVPRLLLIPCFALTFLFGPAGLLLFFVLRMAFAPRASEEAAR
jgi:hypothetical protein